MLGIIVTDTNGNKISFWQATGRYWAKSIFFLIWIVAWLIGGIGYSTGGDNSPYLGVAGLMGIIGFLVLVIGYLMAGFTPEKQALHDIGEGMLVHVNKNLIGKKPETGYLLPQYNVQEHTVTSKPWGIVSVASYLPSPEIELTCYNAVHICQCVYVPEALLSENRDELVRV